MATSAYCSRVWYTPLIAMNDRFGKETAVAPCDDVYDIVSSTVRLLASKGSKERREEIFQRTAFAAEGPLVPPLLSIAFSHTCQWTPCLNDEKWNEAIPRTRFVEPRHTLVISSPFYYHWSCVRLTPPVADTVPPRGADKRIQDTHGERCRTRDVVEESRSRTKRRRVSANLANLRDGIFWRGEGRYGRDNVRRRNFSNAYLILPEWNTGN